MNNITQSDAKIAYAQREARLAAAVRLEQPDRVPSVLFSHFWAARHAGMTCRQAMYDFDGMADATAAALTELQPDSYASPFFFITLGPMLDTLGLRTLLWPGRGVGDDVSYQYLDREYMSADEYDDYLLDPTGFMLTKYLPRVADAYQGFTAFPDLPAHAYFGVPFATASYALPEVRMAFDKLVASGEKALELIGRGAAFGARAADLGFPSAIGAATLAPFDYFADNFRGSKQAMLDMFRRKDKLLAAMDKAVVFLSRAAIRSASMSPCKSVMIPLHWGLDGFMSPAQFKTFFWPSLRRLVGELIDAGLTPNLLWEGDCTSRLETIADVPAGKCVYWFERTDIFKAKEILGGTVCLRGNVPASMLTTGNPTEVTDYCRKLISVVGKGGGFIMDAGVGIPDEAKPENVRAMFETTHRYGRYD